MLSEYGLLQHLNSNVVTREATQQELECTHSGPHVEKISTLENHGWLDSDTYFNAFTPRAAKLAAGATIDLMAGILEGQLDNGFALVRPPGHHCEHHKAMGFCLFNNAVVAVKAMVQRELCRKVLIIDWDVHHGNGTQNMFYEDHGILYFSIHRHDNGFFYPSTGLRCLCFNVRLVDCRIVKTGKAHETGEGFNVNVPLNVTTDEGHGDAQYLLIWRDILLPICREFGPQIILVSAGFDACIGDPLGGMRVTPPCYGLLTRLLLNECSKVGVVLEGGYNLETMPRAMCCVNYALLKGPTEQKDAFNVEEFYDEFKANITDGDSQKKGEHQPFHKWHDDYKDELVEKNYDEYLNEVRKRKYFKTNITAEEDFSVHGSCKKTVQQVLEAHQKHWKCAAENLCKYKSDSGDS